MLLTKVLPRNLLPILSWLPHLSFYLLSHTIVNEVKYLSDKLKMREIEVGLPVLSSCPVSPRTVVSDMLREKVKTRKGL